MSNPKHDPLRTIMGTNLQTGALRAILILGAFTFIGASLAWLTH